MNMRYLILLAFSILVTGVTEAQKSTFQVQVKSLLNGEPVLYAKVSVDKGQQMLSNIDGIVAVEYNAGDQITISHLAFDTLKVDPSKYPKDRIQVLYLTPKVYQLSEVRFSILGNRALFDHKFVKHDLGKSDEERVREKLKIIEMRQELIGLDKSAQGGMVLGSPITYMYERFSKAGKERAKYAALLARDRQAKAAYKKFDNLIIQTLTNYEDEELQRFKDFCSFHPTYVEQVDALELYFEILRCKDEYIEKDY